MLLVPGTSLINHSFMGFVYLCFLGYLFLGIAIIADIFMEAIEVITSSTREQNYQTTRHATFDSGIFELAVSDTIEGYIFHAGTTARNIDGTDNFQTAIYGFYLGA